MTPEQILELADRLASLGVVPILLIGIWQLWIAYQRVVDDLRKAREQIDGAGEENNPEDFHDEL